MGACASRPLAVACAATQNAPALAREGSVGSDDLCRPRNGSRSRLAGRYIVGKEFILRRDQSSSARCRVLLLPGGSRSWTSSSASCRKNGSAEVLVLVLVLSRRAAPRSQPSRAPRVPSSSLSHIPTPRLFPLRAPPFSLPCVPVSCLLSSLLPLSSCSRFSSRLAFFLVLPRASGASRALSGLVCVSPFLSPSLSLPRLPRPCGPVLPWLLVPTSYLDLCWLNHQGKKKRLLSRLIEF